MKKIVLVLVMVAASVFLAQPAVADETDPAATTVTETETPAAEAPAEEPAAEEPPPAEPVAEEPAAEAPPAEVPPAEEPPAEEPPAAEPPAEEPPVVEPPAGDQRAEASPAVAAPEADAAVAAVATNKKIVVCKFVTTPGGELDHIVIVDAPKNFLGVFPTIFPDAQDSVAIRYAAPGEQAHDVALSECDFTPPFDACPNVPGDQPEGTDCETAQEKKVVVCKYVGTPPGTPDHIIVVNESALGDGFLGLFPYAFGDAQDSIAIRFAVGNEQPGDEELVNCPTFPTDITAEAPVADPATCDADGSLVLPETDNVSYTVEPEFDGPGDYTVTASVTSDDFVLVGKTEFDITVGGKLSSEECTEPEEEDVLLPDTGGLPLWILLIAGPMTAAGLIILMRREPVSYAASSGRKPSYSLILPPANKPSGFKRVASTQDIGFMKAVGKVVAAIGSFLRGGRR
ncbi:hypothetical protein [Aeromicrobium ginsengisoli]|uniref:hypothetical protein n=1 Tax=Aeromicrobium ginsengisoli TaxID=363867 RepID=UPI00165F6759|nr:hypothetical protein [Aeromicrobium ginsengisoli]